MDLLIPNSWLKKHLETKATPKEIAKYLSLCGPSIERTKQTNDGDHIYNVEVTTNRVDTASILGIAREAATILPRFGIKASLKENKLDQSKFKFVKKTKYLTAVVDPKLCSRFTAVLIKNVTVKESPKEIRSLLEKVDVRPINNIVDVSNYIMHELGQPVHTFDYDKISDADMTLRESKRGELIKTLDGKEFKLDGGDIVIEDASGNLIDLCGIMGGEASSIDNNTKNVLLFVQNYNQHKIRKTSMSLGQRTEAAVLFEKGLDSENVTPAILSSIEMIENLSGGKSEKEILDIYPNPYKTKTVTVTKEEIDKIIGIDISEKEMTNYLTNLGFGVNWNKTKLEVKVPSYRANDIDIREDIAEEIARIYGYFNLPCVLMDGSLPKPKQNDDFKFEQTVKQLLKSLGATEVYNLSLTDKGQVELKNPLGPDTAFLRDNLLDSLARNVQDNPQEKGDLHIFEISNIYIPRKNDLPEEKLMLGGIIRHNNYRQNKGIVESLLNELNIEYTDKQEDGGSYLPNQRIFIKSDKTILGEYGNLENGLFLYSFDMQKLLSSKKIARKYKEINKYPPQVEDITLELPEKTFVGDVIKTVYSMSNIVYRVELTDKYQSNFTFNIQYQSEDHTLTDKEVEEVRSKILSSLNTKFGISVV
ncbi:MAG: phenylalanine--tRNA ligase subunit beta [Microgenomates group bacterium]